MHEHTRGAAARARDGAHDASRSPASSAFVFANAAAPKTFSRLALSGELSAATRRMTASRRAISACSSGGSSAAASTKPDHCAASSRTQSLASARLSSVPSKK